MTYKEAELVWEAWEYLSETLGHEALAEEMAKWLGNGELTEFIDRFASLHDLDWNAEEEGFDDFWDMVENS